MTTTTSTGLVPLHRARTRARPAGRRSSYALRVSLLEACQLSCGYCMPGAVTPPSKKALWLFAQEHERLARVFAARGVRKVRFTGGEPLLRDDAPDIVAAWRKGCPDASLALTTNGQRLEERLPALVGAGLASVNVHIDSLDEERAAQLMAGGSAATALRGAVAAKSAGLEVKLNVVAQREGSGGAGNHLELDNFLRWSADTSIEVRFIELMDTGSAPDHVRERFLSGEEIVEGIEAMRPLTRVGRRVARDPASLYRCRDDGTVFGIIASDTQPFCDDCDRLRLDAQGRLRGCLYEPPGVALGESLRDGADDAEVGALLDAAIDDKRSFHPLVAISRPAFSMADIGG